MKLGVFYLNETYATFVNHLPCNFTTDDGELVEVIVNPTYYIDPFKDGNPFVSNCDVYIWVDDGEVLDRNYMELIGDKTLKVSRPGKLVESLRAHKASKKYGIQYYLPISYSSNYTNHHHGMVIPEEITKVIFKTMNGARGQGQAILPVELIDVFIGSEPHTKTKDLEKIFPDVKFFPVEDREVTDETFGLVEGAWCIYPYVDDVESEFRILRGGDTLLGYFRTRGDINGETRVITSENHIHGLSSFPDYDEQKKLIEKYIKYSNILGFMNDINFYYGSMDFYITKSGKVGVFEYCPEHGSNLIPPKYMKLLVNSFLKFAVKSLK